MAATPNGNIPTMRSERLQEEGDHGDAEMEDGDRDNFADQEVISGRGVIIKALLDFVVKGVHNPMELFDNQVPYTEEAHSRTSEHQARVT